MIVDFWGMWYIEQLPCHISTSSNVTKNDMLRQSVSITDCSPDKGEIVPRNYTLGIKKIVPRNLNNLCL